MSAAAETRTIPTGPDSCPCPWPPTSEPIAFAVPVTTCQQSPAASRALEPSGYATSFAAGSKPQIQRPLCSIVARGPSVTSCPARRTVTVIGRPWLARISCDTRSKVRASRPLTATMRSPGWSPAACAGVPDETAATSVVAELVGAPVA